MGMFDSVMVPCPKCGERAEFQSKAGDCHLEIFTIDDAPDVVETCAKCRTRFTIAIAIGELPKKRTLVARSVAWQEDE